MTTARRERNNAGVPTCHAAPRGVLPYTPRTDLRWRTFALALLIASPVWVVAAAICAWWFLR